jgi:D-alanyl-D-alanine carboxypeptidase
MSAAALAERVDALVAALPQPGGVRGAIVRVEVPSAGFAHAAAAGLGREDTGEEATVDHRFHVASVGKMFTATLVLQAAEAGSFGPHGIDTPLGDLAFAPRELIDGVHPSGPTITIRQLLTHTSGMKDMQTDDASGTADELGRPAPDSVMANFWRSARALAAGDRSNEFAQHRWVPWNADALDDPMAGMLNRFLATGTAAAPVGAPGERFHYSDTAYVLLGVLVELATGRRFAELQRERICDPLGLVDTTLAYHDGGNDGGAGAAVTSGPARCDRSGVMDVWLGDIALLSAGLDLSFDWGGGGQVSTAADLCGFLRGLLAGSLFDDPRTVAACTQWVHPTHLPPQRLGVGLGLFHWQAGSHALIGHAGAWGVRVFHDPASGAFVAGTVGQRDDCRWLSDVLDAVHAELKEDLP